MALSLGVDAIETDIRATGDGVLVLRHDAELERTTNGRGSLSETRWEVIQTLDAGSWFSETYRGARVRSEGTMIEAEFLCNWKRFTAVFLPHRR